MASIEFLQKRIEGTQKNIQKLNKKMDRIMKAKESNWENNPYWYSENDIRYTTKDIAIAEANLQKYMEQLQAEVEKSNSRNIQVIIDFLEDWKSNVKNYYIDCLPHWIETLQAYHKADSEACQFHNNGGWKFPEEQKEYDKKRIDARKKHQVWNFLDRYIEIKRVDGERHYSMNMKLLQKDLDEEANRKYDFIIERTNKIVGQITDASNLKIGAKADLNGFIIGTKGTAKVQTIGAGGYNIQCYHFRTLINEIK